MRPSITDLVNKQNEPVDWEKAKTEHLNAPIWSPELGAWIPELGGGGECDKHLQGHECWVCGPAPAHNGKSVTGRRMKLEKLEDLELKKPEWLIRHLVSRQALMVIGAAEKSLKSHVALYIAVALVLGVSPFGQERMDLPSGSHRVLYLTGEGGRDLAWARALRLAETLVGTPVTPGSAEWKTLSRALVIEEEIVSYGDPSYHDWFAGSVRDFNPALVIVDPAYIYLTPGENGAGNVFTMGSMIRDIHVMAGGRAVIYVHHFTKLGADDLTLSSLTQAGFREAAESWLLLAVREDAGDGVDSLDGGAAPISVLLEAVYGSRNNARWHRGIHIDLGMFDIDLMEYSGPCSVRITSRDALRDQAKAAEETEKFSQKQDKARSILRCLSVQEEPVTKTKIFADVKGKATDKTDILNELWRAGLVHSTCLYNEQPSGWEITASGKEALEALVILPLGGGL